MRVFSGHFHQGQIVSNFAGVQCTAIALYALLMIFNVNTPQNGQITDLSTPEFVDRIVFDGHHLYTEIIGHTSDPTPRYLGHWELPALIQLNNNLYDIHRYNNMFYGTVGTESNYPFTSVSIEEALPMAFSISNYYVCTFGSSTFAIFRGEGQEQWYLVDSHSRNTTGATSSLGTATIIEFSTLENCIHFIRYNFYGMPFEITPVVFSMHDTCRITEGNCSSENQHETMMTESNRPCQNFNEDNYVTENLSTPAQTVKKSTSLNISQDHSEKFTDTQNYVNINKLHGDERKYEEQIRVIARNHCHCCFRVLFEDQVKKMPSMFSFTLNNGTIIDDKSSVCNKCSSQLSQNKHPNKFADNNLDAGVLPECLKELDVIQRRMISQVQTFMTIVVLPGGQYAEKGLTIHFPLDSQSYLQSLENMHNRTQLVVSHSNKRTQLHCIPIEKLVNFEKVKLSISWLKENNILYIDYPDFTECLCVSQDNDNMDVECDEAIKTVQLGNEAGTVSLNYSIPDINITTLLRKDSKLEIPVQFDKPIWLSQLSHGEELAFPWLFPFGKGGISDNRRTKLSVLDYFQYRLYNKDDRWRKNITYLMYAVNHMEQSKLTDQIEIQMRLHKSNATLTASSLSQQSNLSKIKQNSFMFIKTIRGTVAYWADILQNLLAMVKSLGPPTIFLTLSADDCNWPELKMLLSGMPYECAVNADKPREDMKKDPLFSSVHFERRWKAFFKYVLMGKEKPLGNIEDYFARVEYQNRGSPHMHIFLWVSHAPTLISSSSVNITRYIEQTISTTIPSFNEDPELHSLVKRLQIHHHTKSCKRNNACRFGFPKSPSTETKLLTDIDITSPSSRGHFYQAKRSSDDQYVNAYNPVLLRRWRANMDIQMVSGVHGLAYYVCSYIAKAEPDDLKHALGKVYENINTNLNEYSAKRQLHLIGNCVLKNRRLSAQEAAARIGHLQLTWSSRTTVYLNTRKMEERFKVLLPKCQREKLPDDSVNIFCTGIIDYYMDRPNNLQDISLFKFASWYKMSTSKTVEVSARCCQRIKLPTLDKIMQKRKKPAIIRTPRFQGNSEQYYFSFLMMHLPFRNEKDLLAPYNTAEQAFVEKNDLFNLTDIQFESFLHDIERTARLVRLSRDDIANAVAPNTYEQDENVQQIQISEDHSFINAENVQMNDDEVSQFSSERDLNQFSQAFHSMQVNLCTPEEIQNNIAKLTADQSRVFSVIKTHFDINCNSPFHLFITGGAGTGKSFLIQTIVEWLKLFTSPFEGCDPVLVCGPTGMSAKNIHGKTIHSALKLPIQHGSEPSFKPLSSRTLQELRNRYRSIHTIIVDEISMVSSQTLLYIHRRLSAIKGNEDYFGGLNVILLGDFYQLKPIRGGFAFHNTVLWNLFDTYILQTNMRQRSDDTYSQLLNRIRIGIITKEDIDILSSRLIEQNDPAFDGALRVYPTLKEVGDYNKRKQGMLSQNTVEINADHQFSTSDIGKDEDVNDFIPNDDRDAGGLPNQLLLSIGSRVMLIRNIATDHGLINGALGFVQHIQFENESPIRIFVRFDDSTIGRIFHNDEHDATIIEQISQEFYYKGRSLKRTQFPLLQAWACTIHKVQGISCDKIVLGLGKTVFAEGQAYVALSRVRSLEGLAILSLDPTKIKVHRDVVHFSEIMSLQTKHNH